MPTTVEDRLPLWRKTSFAFGDFANNLYFTTASLFLLFYYTDYLGLSPANAGWVFAVALIWDALFDPFMGYISNRTQTRWGRYRPYLLFGAVPLAVSWALIFAPVEIAGARLLAFALLAHMLFRTFYAVVGTPYQALNAVLTRDSNERGTIAAIRMFFAGLCGLVAAFSTLKLVGAFGGGRLGFFWTAIIYGGFATLIYMTVVLSTREPIVLAGEGPAPIRAIDMLRMLRVNSAFWLVAGAILMGAIGGTMFNKTLPYFFKYNLQAPALVGAALTAGAASVAVSIPIWLVVMRRTSKRVMWLCGHVLGLCVLTALWFIPPRPEIWLGLIALAGFGAGATFLGFWSTIPDTVEFGAFRSGIRAEGAIFGLVLLIEKSALGVAAGILGELLQASGYHANTAQAAHTLASIKSILLVPPMICGGIAVALIIFYPIDHRLHARLNRALVWRDRRKSLR